MEQMEAPTPARVATLPAESLAPDPTPAARRRSRWSTVGLIAGLLIFILLVVAAVYGMVTYPLMTAVIRDIAIIALALITLVTGTLLAILIFQVQSLIALLREEIYPILRSVNDTASTVRGTTTFVSDAVISPVIKVASYAAGVRRTIRTLAKRPTRNDSSHKDSTNQV